MKRLAIATLIVLASQAKAQDCGDRGGWNESPCKPVEQVRVLPKRIVKEPLKPTLKHTNWLKPTRIKIDKQTKLPGPTIKNPRAPLEIPFNVRWDDTYQPEPISIKSHRAVRYPVIPVEVRILSPIHEASLSGVVTAIIAASISVMLLWVLCARLKLNRTMRGIYRDIKYTSKVCYRYVRLVVGNKFRRRRQLPGSHRSRFFELYAHKSELWAAKQRRAKHQRRQDADRLLAERYPADSAIGAWARSFCPQSQSTRT